jgi:hypothetical protein
MNRNISWRAAAAMVGMVVAGTFLGCSREAVRAGEPSLSVDIGFFYDRLAVYGDWRQQAEYGWVWSPRDVAIGWRPYTDGHWVYTDEYGWVWDSDLDWGWACFHYGRWDWDDQFGWFWVPGYHWGPAWVAWRTGPGFVGWAPLPPRVRWEAGIGLSLGGVNLDDIPSRDWIFVEAQFFDAPRIHEHVVLMSRNVTILHETSNVTRFERVDGRVFNASIPIGRVEEWTHRPVEHLRVAHVGSAGAMALPREHDGEVRVFSPAIRQGREGLTPPRAEEFNRREAAERAQLQERQRAEVSRQEERLQAERPGPGLDERQLRQRQQVERQALRSEHERQQRQLEGQFRYQRGGAMRSEGRAGGRPAGQPERSRR